MKLLVVLLITPFVLSCSEGAYSPFAQEAQDLVNRVKSLELQVKQRLSVYIKSEACNDPLITGCGYATITVNGKDYAKKLRGYNVVVVNAKTGIVESSTSYDTYGSLAQATLLSNHLNGIPQGRLVLVAVQDSAEKYMTLDGYNALIKLGAVNPLRNAFRSSYALLGYSGPGQLDAVAQVQNLRTKGPSIISKVLSLLL